MALTYYDNAILAIAGITHYYPLNEVGGSTTVTDQEGAQNSGTVSGVTFGTAGGCADGSTCATGFNLGGQGIPFTGGGPVPSSGSAFTLEIAFFAASGSTAFQRIYADATDALQMLLTNTNNFIGMNSWTAVTAPTKNAWHLAQACVASNGTGKFYLDGALSFTSGVSVQYPSAGASQYIGDNPTGQAINGGKIQKVAIYNFQMLQAQVTTNYTNFTTTPNLALSGTGATVAATGGNAGLQVNTPLFAVGAQIGVTGGNAGLQIDAPIHGTGAAVAVLGGNAALVVNNPLFAAGAQLAVLGGAARLFVGGGGGDTGGTDIVGGDQSSVYGIIGDQD